MVGCEEGNNEYEVRAACFGLALMVEERFRGILKRSGVFVTDDFRAGTSTGIGTCGRAVRRSSSMVVAITVPELSKREEWLGMLRE